MRADPGRLRREYPPGVPPVARGELFAWAMYDFANSGYTTVVITAVFNAWFVATIARGATWATLAWTSALAVSYAAVIATAPVLGAWADRHARKKRILALSTLACVAATAALGLCGPGDAAAALALVIVSNAAFGTGENVIAAFLPELADEHAFGRLSGFGWALGYVGGVALLALSLVWIDTAAARGSSTGEAVPQTLYLTAACFLLAALPTLVVLRERSPAKPHLAPMSFAASWVSTVAALRGARGLHDLLRLLGCVVCYQAGVGTVITIAAIFTQEALGFTPTESIQLVLAVNVTAALGAFAFGFLQDRLGHLSTLAATLLAWLVAIGLFAASDSRDTVWIAANVAGLSLGATQSVGRALVAYLCPPDREAEIFGLWGLATKVAMILGPLCYGIVNAASDGNHRLALLVTAVFFVAALLQLGRVDVARGRAAALAPH
jgi:UMF1 family MFS transporter